VYNLIKSINRNRNRMEVCPKCRIERVHSFRIVKRMNDHACFFTSEDEVKDRNPEFISEHIIAELEAFHSSPPSLPFPSPSSLPLVARTWSWTYDSRNFVFDFFAIDAFMRLLEIFTRFGGTLTRIDVIANSHMKRMLEMVSSMLPDYMARILFVHSE